MRHIAFAVCLAGSLSAGLAHAQGRLDFESIESGHLDHVSQLIDQAVNPTQPPAGFKGLMIGYQDDYGRLYKPYGRATQDGSVPLDQNTMFGIGSVTKLFAATLLALAVEKGLSIDTPVRTLLPGTPIAPSKHRYPIRLVDLADHHAGLPKNAGHLFSSIDDLYADYSADPITCDHSTSELLHDCGCCSGDYMALLGLAPTCGTGVAQPVYSCATHGPTQGANGWVYSNEAFEVLGAVLATWLGHASWNDANWAEISSPLGLADTIPLESFGPSQVARAANHCNPATRTSNVNCQLLGWLPVGNAAGGLFSTAQDILHFLAYNAYGPFINFISDSQPQFAEQKSLHYNPYGPLVDFGDLRLQFALFVIHHNYEYAPGGGQELGWQTSNLSTGELVRWKEGDNGPFNAWVGYVKGPLTRMIVLLDNSDAWGSADLGRIGMQVLEQVQTQ